MCTQKACVTPPRTGRKCGLSTSVCTSAAIAAPELHGSRTHFMHITLIVPKLGYRFAPREVLLKLVAAQNRADFRLVFRAVFRDPTNVRWGGARIAGDDSAGGFRALWAAEPRIAAWFPEGCPDRDEKAVVEFEGYAFDAIRLSIMLPDKLEPGPTRTAVVLPVASGDVEPRPYVVGTHAELYPVERSWSFTARSEQ